MNKKPPSEAAKIAEYRLHAAAQRARSHFQSNSGVPDLGITIVEGVATLTQPSSTMTGCRDIKRNPVSTKSRTPPEEPPGPSLTLLHHCHVLFHHFGRH